MNRVVTSRDIKNAREREIEDLIEKVHYLTLEVEQLERARDRDRAQAGAMMARIAELENENEILRCHLTN